MKNQQMPAAQNISLEAKEVLEILKELENFTTNLHKKLLSELENKGS